MIHEYALRGDATGVPPFYQVEPEASYWLRCPVLCNVELNEIQADLDRYFRDHPYPASDSAQAQEELDIIQFRFDNREVSDAPDIFDPDRLSDFLRNPLYFQSPPPGAVLSKRSSGAGVPPIRNGGELARLFEAETPGLWHRHVLNVILDVPRPEAGGLALRQTLSPPRQALIWMALETAIFSALSAVWHYKWIASGLNQVARRERPWEAVYQNAKSGKVDVLFDYQVAYDAGSIVRGELKSRPEPSPGSPRHPAYGSGHSTYSAAASDVLACLLPPQYSYGPEFERLAEDIGQARIWGGVHWQTDHEAGQVIGRLVGKRIIEQLNRSGIAAMPSQLLEPPTRETLQTNAEDFELHCGEGREDFCGASISPDTVGAQAQ